MALRSSTGSGSSPAADDPPARGGLLTRRTTGRPSRRPCGARCAPTSPLTTARTKRAAPTTRTGRRQRPVRGGNGYPTARRSRTLTATTTRAALRPGHADLLRRPRPARSSTASRDRPPLPRRSLPPARLRRSLPRNRPPRRREREGRPHRHRGTAPHRRHPHRRASSLRRTRRDASRRTRPLWSPGAARPRRHRPRARDGVRPRRWPHRRRPLGSHGRPCRCGPHNVGRPLRRRPGWGPRHRRVEAGCDPSPPAPPSTPRPPRRGTRRTARSHGDPPQLGGAPPDTTRVPGSSSGLAREVASTAPRLPRRHRQRQRRRRRVPLCAQRRTAPTPTTRRRALGGVGRPRASVRRSLRWRHGCRTGYARRRRRHGVMPCPTPPTCGSSGPTTALRRRPRPHPARLRLMTTTRSTSCPLASSPFGRPGRRAMPPAGGTRHGSRPATARRRAPPPPVCSPG